ncbi:AlkA N-terminal domain-containing protein [soil metagenome]
MIDDFERCYGAVRSRDRRFDGWFFIAVTSTGIYCRPSCPAMTPKRSNIVFHPTAASAQRAGFRACKRCRPDASPGSPEWDRRADLVGRAMRLIADGVVDREGVAGLAARLAYSERHLHRQLVAELGAGPIALARAQRAQTARILIETTALGFADIAFAAGFASVRQFNDTVRQIFATTPTALRTPAARRAPATSPGSLSLRLPYRAPFDGRGLLGFLRSEGVPGVEHIEGTIYRRSLDLPHGPAVVQLDLGDRAPSAKKRSDTDFVPCELRLTDLRDLASAVARCRRLLDLDADPTAVDAHLGADPDLAPLMASRPGTRILGTVDGTELALRAVLGQQISVAGARTLTARLVAALGTPLAHPDGTLTHLFPRPEAIAAADPSTIPLTAARTRALQGLAGALASGEVRVDPGADREQTERRLLALPGIGPWTVAVIALHGLGDPDAFLPTDLIVRRGTERLGLPSDPVALTARAERWRPWRGYAVMALWASIVHPLVHPHIHPDLQPLGLEEAS